MYEYSILLLIVPSTSTSKINRVRLRILIFDSRDTCHDFHVLEATIAVVLVFVCKHETKTLPGVISIDCEYIALQNDGKTSKLNV